MGPESPTVTKYMMLNKVTISKFELDISYLFTDVMQY